MAPAAHNPLLATAGAVPLRDARGWLSRVLQDVESAERDRDPMAPAMRSWAVEAMTIVAARRDVAEGV